MVCVNQWRIQDFPEEGAPTPQGGHQHTILPKFPKNCMKLKEFGPPGGRASPAPPLRSATVNEQSINLPCLVSHVIQTCFSLMVRNLIEVLTSIVIARKRSLRQGNVFTHVCDSVHKEGVSVQGVSVQGGSLCKGGLCHETAEERAVRILLECILVRII